MCDEGCHVSASSEEAPLSSSAGSPRLRLPRLVPRHQKDSRGLARQRPAGEAAFVTYVLMTHDSSLKFCLVTCGLSLVVGPN